jgi:hypothetical protein
LDLEMATPAGGRQTDPAYLDKRSIFHMWASMLWDRDPAARFMHQALRKQAQRLAYAPRGNVWQAVIGPAGAILATAARINWKVLDATTFVDHEGRSVDTTQVCPYRLGLLVDDATEQALARETAWRLHAPHLSRGAWLAPLRKLVHNKKLPSKGRAHLRSTVVGAQWTEADKHRAGLVPTPACQRCLVCVGDLRHRHWECDATFPTRRQCVGWDVRASGLNAEPTDMFWTRCLCPHPRQAVAPPNLIPTRACVLWERAPDDGLLSEKVYTDGSRTVHKYP